MKRSSRHSRRGVAIIIVLTMISIALAVSYAMLRTQTTTEHIQENSNRRMQAHNAAMAGLADGIRRMHLNSWTGVGSTISGSVNATDSYSVSYIAGDSQLLPSDPQYRDWHIRVSVVATGKSVNPAKTSIYSSHEARAVVQLIPQALGSQPNNWAQASSHALYQTGAGTFSMQVPGRIEGPVRLQGAVELGNSLSWSSSARSRYFADLEQMRTARNEIQTVSVNGGNGSFRLHFNGQTTGNISHNASASTVRTALRNLGTVGAANVDVSGSNGGPYTVTFVNSLGNQDVPQMIAQNVSLSGSNAGVWVSLTRQGSAGYPDCRPLVGPLSLPLSASDTTNRNLLNSLGLQTTNISVSSAMTLPLPTTLTSYRIYPGGPVYQVPQVSSNLSQTSLVPQPQTNPLGIFFCNSQITVNNNVTVTGTLISGSHVNVRGSNVQIQGLPIWPLTGSSASVQLPTLVARRDLAMDGDDVTATINGLVLVGEEFSVDEGSESAAMALNGRLLTRHFVLKRRSNWNYAPHIWNLYYNYFTGQENATDGMPFFPIYMAQLGRNPNPTLTIKYDPSPLVNHWQDLSSPIYVPLPNELGLRWEVVRMETAD